MSKVKKEKGKVLISQELYDELMDELRRKDAEIARVNAEADHSKAEAALCRETLADKDTQLMSEQARRDEIVEQQVEARINIERENLKGEYIDREKEISAREKKVDEREADLERQKMEIVDKMHEYVKAEVEKARLKMEAKNEEINAFKLKLYNIQQSAIDTLKSLIMANGDPVKTDACLRNFEQKTHDAREEMTSEYYKALEKLSKKKISLSRQVQSLLRMIFL